MLERSDALDPDLPLSDSGRKMLGQVAGLPAHREALDVDVTVRQRNPRPDEGGHCKAFVVVELLDEGAKLLEEALSGLFIARHRSLPWWRTVQRPHAEPDCLAVEHP